MYYNSVGHNTSLILGLTPNADGLMPEPDVQRLKELGDELERRFSTPIVSVAGNEEVLIAKLPKRQLINQLVLVEKISKGERVRQFVIEGKTKKGWQLIVEGSCIGHKFIHQFDEMEVTAVRLKIMQSKGEPQIQSLEVFKID